MEHRVRAVALFNHHANHANAKGPAGLGAPAGQKQLTKFMTPFDIMYYQAVRISRKKQPWSTHTQKDVKKDPPPKKKIPTNLNETSDEAEDPGRTLNKLCPHSHCLYLLAAIGLEIESHT